jgi:hypothetical protein
MVFQWLRSEAKSLRLSRSRTALGVVAWMACLFAVYAIFMILSMWFLVPNNPYQSSAKNIEQKLEIMAAFAAALMAFIAIARWCFARRSLLVKGN